MTSCPDELPRNRETNAFERRVAAVLGAHLSEAEPVVVACSGGPDSVAALIATVRGRPGVLVTAACFDHRLREASETEGDVAFVRDVARRVGACFVSGAPSVELGGDEAGARQARYGWLAEVCGAQDASVCVTGHTEDDQAETVLLRLTRGSGLRGAAGMRVESAWPVAVGLAETPAAPPGGASGERLRVLRPLLDVSRAEVEGYLEALGLEARVDPTNELVTYARNRVRRRVLPELEELNAGAKRHLAAFAERAAQDDAALAEWAARELRTHGVVEAGSVKLTRTSLKACPPAISTRVVQLAAGKLGLELTSEQLSGALRALWRGGFRVSIVGGEVRTEGEYLVIRQD